MQNKSILLVHRYYHPDTPAYATMLHKIAINLKSTGFDVDVFTSMPSYYGTKNIKPPKKEIIKGINIYRSRLLPEPNRAFLLRTFNSIIFSFLTFMKIIIGKKYALVTVATTPPIMISTIVKIACRIKGISYLYHCQDIYPEIAFFSGNLKNSLGYNILKKFDTHTCKKALKVVVLSRDMKNTLIERGVEEKNIAVINNFIRSTNIQEEIVDLKKFKIRAESFKIVFCGNLGKMQKLPIILSSFIKLIENTKLDIQLIFIGEGVLKSTLMRNSDVYLHNQIIFTGYQPLKKAVNFLKGCDLGLIPIAEGVHKTAYPSKTMTNLSCGLKSLVLVEEDSEMNEFFSTNNLGYTAPPNDEDAILKAFNYALKDGKSSALEKEKIKNIALDNFSEEHIMKLWTKTISKLVKVA